MTIKTYIPNYIQTSSTTWTLNTANPTRLATLALVGMHVVGSVKGHPEMIWSTFEHVYNAPSPLDTTIASLAHVEPNDYIFNDSISTYPVNVPHISGHETLSGINGFNIHEPAKIVRNQPFGWAGNAAAAHNNPADILDPEVSNDQLRNLYSDIRNRLHPNDVRRNYFQVGAMWTSLNPITSANPALGQPHHEAGTVRLSNATMETFTQATSNSISGTAGAGLNCFSCHNRGVNDNGTFVGTPAPYFYLLSHVFGYNITP